MRQNYFIAIILLILILIVSFRPVLSTDDRPSTGPSAGRTTYETNCMGCHGSAGVPTDIGKTLMAADLQSPEVQKETDAILSGVVMNGKNNMPAFKSLSKKQVRAVITYVRSLSKNKKNGETIVIVRGGVVPACNLNWDRRYYSYAPRCTTVKNGPANFVSID
jgi:mono/diheme cytochrome c family protein